MPSTDVPARIEAATGVADRVTFTTPDGGKVACELSESSGAHIHRVVLEHDDVSITVDHPAHSAYLNLTLVWKDGRLTRHLVPADSTDSPSSMRNESVDTKWLSVE